jgi:hypothetical protein
MNTGSLYQVSWGFWLLFPTKEIISTIIKDECYADVHGNALAAADYAAWYNRQYNCNVSSWFSPDSLLVCLEEDGKFKKLLTSEGLIGWIRFGKGYNESFEEVKTEQ